LCSFEFEDMAIKQSGLVGIVDTTSCPIEAPYFNTWEYWDSHYYCYAFKYQIIICSPPINHYSFIIDVKGPYKARAHDKTIARNFIIPKLSKSEILMGDSLYDNEQYILTGMTNTKKLNATKREKLIGNMVHSVRQNVERIYRICKRK